MEKWKHWHRTDSRDKEEMEQKRKWAGESGGTVVDIGLCSNIVTLLKIKVFKYLTNSSILVHPNNKHLNSIQPYFSIYRLCFATLYLCWLFWNIWKAWNEHFKKKNISKSDFNDIFQQMLHLYMLRYICITYWLVQLNGKNWWNS